MPSNKPLRDYYKILGVDKSASFDEIKSAYRSLARKFHPDINKSEDNIFWMQLINEAYEVLGSKRKKALYDYVFFADSRFYSHDKTESTSAPSSVSTQQTGFRNSFSHFIISVIGTEESLNIALGALLLIAVSFYLIFGQAELAAVMMGLFLVIAFIVLMVRVVAEIFGRVGIRQEEEWFHEAFIAAGYLESNANKNL
jgi:DnaJ domain